MFVGKGKGGDKILKEFVWTFFFKIFFPKYLVVRRIIFGCHHSFFGRRGHEDTRILLPWRDIRPSLKINLSLMVELVYSCRLGPFFLNFCSFL